MRGRGRRTATAIAIALLALAALPAGALSGGFVTIGLGSLPDGVAAGETWSAEVTVLAHGRSPADYMRPVVVIAPADGESGQRFRARPTDRPGVYRAAVAFPTTGRWSYAVDTGWGGVTSFGHVTIGEAADDAGGTAAHGGGTPADGTASGDGGTPSGGAAPRVDSAPAGSRDDDLLPGLLAALAAGLVTALVVAGVQRRREGRAEAPADPTPQSG